MLRYAVLSLNSWGICDPQRTDVYSPRNSGRNASNPAMYVFEYAVAKPKLVSSIVMKSSDASIIIGINRAVNRAKNVHLALENCFIWTMNIMMVCLIQDGALYLLSLWASESDAL